ncbi:MAG: thiamine pyrophosphate-dependent enzyme [Verrucomicrobiota bacterium]
MSEVSSESETSHQIHGRLERAKAIVKAGGFEEALALGALANRLDITLSESIVLGLVRQNVRTFVTVLGHGSTDLGEVLRVYEQAGLVRSCGVRNEIEASHAAMALRWVTGEKAAVVTSIGPGALQALAASLAPACDGVGVWYLFGDETTQDEGPNMQQIPGAGQHSYLQLCSAMGQSYCLHTPEAVGIALRRGLNAVDHPHRPGPFYLLMPMNAQPKILQGFNLEELPTGVPPRLGAAAGDEVYSEAVDALLAAKRVVIKIGGGGREAGEALGKFLELVDGVAVTSPLVSGVIPSDHPRNMTVGGSKGSISGNYAMEEADLLVAVGTRFVCQSDCSRTGYPKVKRVININTDLDSATHYGRSIALLGDAEPTLERLIEELGQRGQKVVEDESEWLTSCREKRAEWEAFKKERYETPALFDEVWGEKVMTQPVAIKTATDWARANDAVTFFDAGDPQANAFQIVEDDRLGRTFTETGASYMGFAVSALLSTALASKPFYGLAISGDGSFTMNPQILIDGVAHGACGCILLLDNRRMAAISGLQVAQYGCNYATNDQVEVDYLAWAGSIKGVKALDGGSSKESLTSALEKAHDYDGLSLVYVPVYHGSDPLGGMGVFGRWNVGSWCEDTQALRHDIGL